MITSRFHEGFTIVYDGNEEIARHEGNKVKQFKEMQESVLDLIHLSENTSL